MKIALDIQPIMKKSFTGIPFYGYKIMEAMIKIYPNDSFVLNYFNKGVDNFNKKRIYKLKKNNCAIIENNGSSTMYRILNLLFPLNYTKYFQNADIVYFCSFFLPRRTGTKCIFTIHDMVATLYPETTKWINYLILKLELKRSVKRADRIVTVSESSKNDIVKLLNVPEDNIDIVTPAYDKNIFNVNYNKDDILKCRIKFNINNEYILYVGTLEPRKNLVNLIKAYEQAFLFNKDIPQLVIAGGNGWKYESIFEAADKCKLKNHIIFTGYIDDADVPLLMNGAMMFVFPSIYEGFGMPCLEAMACGTPVITSNISSMPEVVGNAGILISPNSIEDISINMKRLFNDTTLRKRCREAGLERAKNFSWTKSAQKLHKVFEEVLSL